MQAVLHNNFLLCTLKKIFTMKHTIKILCTMLLSCSLMQLAAQNDSAQKAMMAYMTPGEMHKMLAKADGKWKEDITMWMAPGTQPVKNTATAENKMILGGRYQQTTHTGTFMNMPFEGISTIGFDNAKKVFVSSWVDNMGTGIMYMEGTMEPGSKTITFKGKSTDPATGNEMDVKQTFKWIDDKTQALEMFMVQGGQEFKTMEIKFTKM